MSMLIFRNEDKQSPPTASSPPSGKRSEKKGRTLRAILKAALSLFERHGFDHTTTRAISRKAKIAEGTLFNYFQTKEDLALYFFRQELDSVIEWYESNKKIRRAPLPEKLFAIIHYLLERAAPNENFIGAVYLRSLHPSSTLCPLSPQAREHNVRYLRFISDVLAESASSQEIPPVGDLGVYAFALFHLAIVTYWLQDRSAGKQQTLALLDRCLKTATMFVKKGAWEWETPLCNRAR